MAVSKMRGPEARKVRGFLQRLHEDALNLLGG